MPTTSSAPLAPPSFDLLSSAASNEQTLPPPFTSPPTFESMMASIPPVQSFVGSPSVNASVPPPAFDDAFFSQPPVVNQQLSPPSFDSSFLHLHHTLRTIRLIRHNLAPCMHLHHRLKI